MARKITDLELGRDTKMAPEMGVLAGWLLLSAEGKPIPFFGLCLRMLLKRD